MARELLAILHKSLQMHEGHREHIIRELELGSASVGRHVTAAVADDRLAQRSREAMDVLAWAR
jgi:hypothetical protein